MFFIFIYICIIVRENVGSSRMYVKKNVKIFVKNKLSELNINMRLVLEESIL